MRKSKLSCLLTCVIAGSSYAATSHLLDTKNFNKSLPVMPAKNSGALVIAGGHQGYSTTNNRTLYLVKLNNNGNTSTNDLIDLTNKNLCNFKNDANQHSTLGWTLNPKDTTELIAISMDIAAYNGDYNSKYAGYPLANDKIIHTCTLKILPDESTNTGYKVELVKKDNVDATKLGLYLSSNMTHYKNQGLPFTMSNDHYVMGLSGSGVMVN